MTDIEGAAKVAEPATAISFAKAKAKATVTGKFSDGGENGRVSL